MKKVMGGLGCLGLLAFLLVSVSAQAATVPVPHKTAVPRYDASKEITLEGNVSSIKEFVPGKLIGGHMFVATSKGTIDGHLGPFALRGTHRIAVPAGAHVRLVGVMTSMKGGQVFLVRTIEAGEKTYTIRNEHGFPVLQGAKEATKTLTLTGGRR
jgi:hypothetical protein